MTRAAILEEAAESLKRRATLNNDHAVLQWVKTLPALTDSLLTRWGLTPHGSADNGALSSCVFVTDSNNNELILKIPSNPTTGNREYSLLKTWGKDSISPETVNHSPTSGAILMERITPGQTAEPHLHANPTGTITETLTALHNIPEYPALPPASTFINQRLTWAYERYDKSPEYVHILNYASHTATQLLASQTTQHPLHGDLQPKNLLTTEDPQKVKVIDPFGLEGEQEIDYALWAVVQQSGTSINETLNLLAETNLTLNKERLQQWALYYSILELRPHAKQYVNRIREHLANTEPFMRLPNSHKFITQT